MGNPYFKGKLDGIESVDEGTSSRSPIMIRSPWKRNTGYCRKMNVEAKTPETHVASLPCYEYSGVFAIYLAVVIAAKSWEQT